MKQQRKKKKIGQISLGFALLLAFLLLWVRQTVVTTQQAYKIAKLREEIKKEEETALLLKMQRDKYSSLEFVEWTAKNKLGLIAPKEENIVLLNVNEGVPPSAQ